MAKLCCVCGDDVAAKKRVKDPKGHYYCQTCYEKRRAAVEAKRPASSQVAMAVASGGGNVDMLEGLPELPPMEDGSVDMTTLEALPSAHAPADDGMLDLAPEVKPAHKEVPKLGCATCKRLVPEKQIKNLDGEFICQSCFAKRNAPGTKTKAAKSSNDAASRDGFANSVLGGIALALGALVGVFGIVSAINMALPLPEMMADSSTAMGMGAVYSVYNLGICVILWVGVMIAVKVTGGNGPTFAAMLWKSFVLGGVLTIFSRFRDQISFGDGIGIVGTVIMIIRYYVLRIGVGALFGLEMLPSRLIAVATVVLGWLVGFLFYVLMGALVVTGTVHMKNEEGNAIDFGKEFQKGVQQELDRQKHARGHATEPANNDQAVDNAPAGNAPAGEPAPEPQPAPQ